MKSTLGTVFLVFGLLSILGGLFLIYFIGVFGIIFGIAGGVIWLLLSSAAQNDVGRTARELDDIKKQLELLEQKGSQPEHDQN